MSIELDTTLAALADPTRREVIDLLRQRPQRAGELARATEMSTAAMSRHLRVLRSSGLVTVDPVEDDARLRVYRLDPEPFSALRAWSADATRRQDAEWSALLAGFGGESVERVLLDRLAEFLDAIAAGNIQYFVDHLTDDALLIFPGHGNVYDKAQCIASMGTHPPYVKHTVQDPTVVHLSESSAVLVHHARVRRSDDGADRAYVISSSYVLRDGTWKLAVMQWTAANET